ncbi:MAG: hypothetical protein PSV43_00295, partial [Prosthecobacter sp.]
ALSAQAKTKQGAEADRLWTEASQQLLAAEAIQRGSAAYNLACLKALKNHESESVQWLHVAAECGHKITAEELAKDSDFDLIRNEPAFRAFVSNLPRE